MTRHVHLTPLGGMAGDMFVAALLDALPELEADVLETIRAVLPDDAQVTLTPVLKSGLLAKEFRIAAAGSVPIHFPDMRAILERAAVADAVKATAITMLTALAEAEAAAHGIPVDRVHFHEVADWDTLADLVAAAFLIEASGIDGWSLAPLPLGGGTIETAHGRLAVPAPATARLLEGLPVADDGIKGERVTPTGAAIAKTLPLTPRPAGRMGASGHGAGSRDLPGVANLLIAHVIDTRQAPTTAPISVLSFDVDDMTGEELATAADRLRQVTGVVDLTTTPRAGKKGRPFMGFRLLVDPARQDDAIAACFDETSTLGLRVRTEDRHMLVRHLDRHGDLRVKRSVRPSGTTTKVEADELVGTPGLARRRTLAAKAEGQ